VSNTAEVSAKSLKGVFLGSSALSIILGLVLLAWPGRSTIVVAWIAILFIAISVIERTVAIFGAGKPMSVRILNALGALISGFLVYWVFSFRAFDDAVTVADYYNIAPASIGAVLLLGIIVGINWIVSGAIGMATAIGDSNIANRGFVVAWGIMSIAAGTFVLLFPASVTMFAVVFGVFLLVIGIIGFIAALVKKK
jgi:uncharacterized membrane protein HdeD (DUF308 family)